jgi:hypothetical protein
MSKVDFMITALIITPIVMLIAAGIGFVLAAFSGYRPPLEVALEYALGAGVGSLSIQVIQAWLGRSKDEC